jgi:hypothetical protein
MATEGDTDVGESQTPESSCGVGSFPNNGNNLAVFRAELFDVRRKI